ncbi:hypothetical protein [Clostridium sp. LIBA-8841]|uniref:hypothetical protein n=1 Tax=Clostridium sp. LIBA-8841 TaxID=2987530 RepID=UPI002AC6C82C|nr:hypothetical protein [Clostridium sp. LIBA-8841]MDZ5253653.1 hypothetical protein [Clostridium sp. LIBA-8841]
MKNIWKFGIGALVLLVLSLGIIGFKKIAELEKEVSFYCKIAAIKESSLIVKGIPENDINHRGSFHFKVDSNTKILNSNNEKLNFEDLQLWQEVEVTYDGQVLETEPAQLEKVYKIKIIE